MTNPGTPITNREIRYYDNRVIYEFETTHGVLDAIFDRTSRWFGISGIDVDLDHRRLGIGKSLLQAALDLAYEEDASLIYASITSRECLDAMRSVFGDEAVRVMEEGSYLELGQSRGAATQAGLWYIPAK